MKRLDEEIRDRGLAPSRDAARRLVEEGRVLVDGVVVTKPDRLVSHGVSLKLSDDAEQFVSRGALKLIKAIDDFGIDVRGRNVLDVGASTGGFTDLLLRRGAARSICVDVGYGILHWKLRSDPRVVVMERTNARHLDKKDLPYRPDLVVIDVSFISAKKVMGPAVSVSKDGADILLLVKPQFEAGRENVEKGGVVRNPSVHVEVLVDVMCFGSSLGATPVALSFSPIRNRNKNIEYWAHFRKSSSRPVVPDELREMAKRTVKEAFLFHKEKYYE